MSELLTLELPAEQAEYFIELSEQSPKTLAEVYLAFKEIVSETAAHPFRSQLTSQMEEILACFEALPELDCETLPKEAYAVMKGWLMQNVVMVGFISGWYEAMSKEA